MPQGKVLTESSANVYRRECNRVKLLKAGKEIFHQVKWDNLTKL